MHIVFFVDFHDSTVGGVQTSVRSQKQALETAGHIVTTVCPASLLEVVDAAPAIITLPYAPLIRFNGFPMVLPTTRNLARIEKALQSLPPVDVVHIQTNIGVGVLGHWFAKKHKLPSVQTMHGRDDVLAAATSRFPRLETTVARFLHKRFFPHDITARFDGLDRVGRNAWTVMLNQAASADRATVPSHHFKQKFFDHGYTGEMSVISNGLDDALLEQVSPQKMRVNNGTLQLLWCGRLSSEKRPLEVIDAVNKCVQPVHLTIIGNGPLESGVRQKIIDSRSKKKIELITGLHQSEILRRMTSYDVLVYSSFGFDNQPMVLLEATAAELPVILCDPDLMECVPPRSAVLTSSPGSEAMATMIDELALDVEKQVLMRRSMRRHKHTVRQFTHTQKMLKLYAELIASHNVG